MNLSSSVGYKLSTIPVFTLSLFIVVSFFGLIYFIIKERQKKKKRIKSKIPGPPIIPSMLENRFGKREGGLRQFDTAQLIPEIESKRLKAIELAKTGDYLGAAKVLEDVQLHREAIELLESNNLIDDAAAMLMRLNRPNRAAVLFERNKKFDKAAIYYLHAKLADEAKRCCKQIPKLTHGLSIELSVLFAEAGDKVTALRLLAIIGDKIKIIRLVRDSFAYCELAAFLDQPAARNLILEVLSSSDIAHMLENMPNDAVPPLERARLWLAESQRSDWIIPIFHYIADKREIAHNFAQKLNNEIVESFTKSVSSSDSEFVLRNTKNLGLIARSFHDAEHWPAAAVIYEKLNLMTLAGKCWALSGQESNALRALKSPTGDAVLIEKYLAELIKIGRMTTGEKPLSAREIYSLTQCFFNVDPDVEMRRLESPFSIAS